MVQNMNIQYVQFYTSGSVARRILPAPKAYTDTLTQIKKRKVQRIYVDPVAALGIVVAVCMLIMMAVGVNQLRHVQQQTAVMEQQVEQLRMENKLLQAEYAAQCDLDAVEKTALALGMIPRQEAEHISIVIEPCQTQESVTLWNRIGTFLTGLFA